MSDPSIGQEGTRYLSGVGEFVEEPPGTLIGGHYEVVSLIGRGGMGAVYRCRDQRLGRPVALKRILALSAGGAAGLERFRREAQAVASLNHRNIVVVHEFAEDPQGPYLVMEFLEGADLGSVIAARGALPVAEVIDIARQIGGALAYAHRRGVIHRDIKPANLFRLKDGSVKVVDFGLARLGTDSQLSMEGFGLGTLDYVSPEQRRDASRVDHRSDLFSLGATLYNLATGKAPRLVRERDLPDALRDTVLALMEDRPEDRPFSVGEALATLVAEDRTTKQPPIDVRAAAEGTCLACGALNSATDRFCHTCGGGLFESCPGCKTEARAGRKFCAKCGTSMSGSRTVADVEPHAEPVTVAPATVVEAPPREIVEARPAEIVVAVASVESEALPVPADEPPPLVPPEALVEPPATVPDELQVFAKVRRRLLPFMCLLSVAASLDPASSAGFAMMYLFRIPSETMVVSAALFAAGSFLFAIPSTAILRRVGARRWLAALVIACGLTSAGFTLVSSVTGFLAIRLLRGIAQAGVLPGLLFYLTIWFPRRYRAQAAAMLMSASVIAGIIGTALASVVARNLESWQGVSLLAAVVTMGFGLATLGSVSDGPDKASWLTPLERNLLQDAFDEDRRRANQRLSPGRIVMLSGLYFLVWLGLYVIAVSWPQAAGLESLSQMPGASTASFFVVLLIAAVAMSLAGRHSDRRAERRWHVAGPLLVAACGLGVSGFALTNAPAIALGGLALGTLALWCLHGPFWAMATDTPTATGIAWIVAVGSLAGVAAPFLRDTFGYSVPTAGLVVAFLAAGVTVAAARVRT